MLSKLIKHEFKATGRIFMFVYIAVIVMALVNIAVPWETLFNTDGYSEATSNTILNIIMVVVGGLYVVSVLAVVVVTIIVNISRFYKNLMGDEGYLMFTLPVTKDNLIISKLVVALVWNICSFIIVILSMMILFGRYDMFEAIAEGISSMRAQGFNIEVMALLLIITGIIGAIGHLLMLYTAMTVGPNMMKNRLGGSIVAYIIVYVIVQTVSTAGIAISGLIIRQKEFIFYDTAAASSTFQAVFNNAIIMGIVISLIVSIVGYIITRFMLNKKLNLI